MSVGSIRITTTIAIAITTPREQNAIAMMIVMVIMGTVTENAVTMRRMTVRATIATSAVLAMHTS